MRRFIAAGLLGAALAGCAGTERTTAAAPSALVGTYVVSSYAGRELPAAIAQDGRGAVYLTADTLTIAADGSFRRAGHLRAGATLDAATDDGMLVSSGRVSGSPDAIRFSTGAGEFTGALDGSRLSVTGAVTVVFDKL